MRKIKLSRLKSIEHVIPLILIIICVASARFIDSEAIVLLVFLAALAIYTWRRYDSRVFVGTALFLLVLCAVLLVK